MQEWNAVVSINESGMKAAYARLGAFGLLKKTGFFNVLLMKVDDPPWLLEKPRTGTEDDPASLSLSLPVGDGP